MPTEESLQNVSYVEDYLKETMKTFVEREEKSAVQKEALAEKVFDILINKKFCYLTKKKSAKYKRTLCNEIKKYTDENNTIEFCYVCGGGYHASLSPDEIPGFDVGLSELFILVQVRRLADEIAYFYPPGIRFTIFFDNLCAHLSNNIPIESTYEYSKQFLELIRNLGMESYVSVQHESDLYTTEKYSRALKPGQEMEVTEREIMNAKRFYFGKVDDKDAEKIASKYLQIHKTQAKLLYKFCQGIMLRQRANDKSLPFRSFPGGDSRMQCGEVGLLVEGGRIRKPVLVTSANIKDFKISEMKNDGLLPEPIKSFLVLEKKS